jgi:tryptophan-rich sensory protein
MNVLFINWVIILVIGFLLSRYFKQMKSFQAGIISIIIGTIITYGVHALWVSTSNLIWSLIAVGHASFWAGFFSSLNK